MRKTKVFISLATAIWSAVFCASAKAAPSARIFIDPAQGTFTTDSTFDVSVLLDTGGFTVNAVDVTIQFPADKLQVVNPSTGNSFVSIWLQQPSFSNEKGTLHFVGGVTGKGINTSSGLVSTITFRAKDAGDATVKITDNSTVLVGDGEGTKLPTMVNRAIFHLIQNPPSGPKVFSVTHPDQEAWSRNNNVSMGWDAEDTATNYSYSFSKDPAEIPDNTDDTAGTSANFPNTADGIWYFHIKQKKTGIYGEPTHYRVKIDTTMPADFKPKVELLGSVLSRPALVSFLTTDAQSGIDHYTIAVFDQNKESGDSPIFVEATSPYRIPNIGSGNMRVVVKAYDKAGNVRDGSIDVSSSSMIVGFIQSKIAWLGLGMVFMLLLLLAAMAIRRRARVQVILPQLQQNPHAITTKFTIKR